MAAAVGGARSLVAVQVLWDGEEADAALALLDPLWAWLFRERPGLLQADGEGFYDSERLILRVE